MINGVKKAIFLLWYFLDKNLPFNRGKHRISLLLHRIFGTAVYRIGGIKLALNPHEFFWRNLMNNRLTDDDVKRGISEYLKEGDVFIDIGANIGYFSLIAAIDKKAHVFAFEPSKREISRIAKNISLNKANDKIVLFPFGISDKSQELVLNISTLAHPGMNSVVDLSEIANVHCKEKAKFHPIGTLLTDDILCKTRLCKIDVEGYEPLVLEGLRDKMVHLARSVFIVEISPAYLAEINFSKEFIYDFFKEFGFKPIGYEEVEGQYNEFFIKSGG